jgi:hypothetical protein
MNDFIKDQMGQAMAQKGFGTPQSFEERALGISLTPKERKEVPLEIGAATSFTNDLLQNPRIANMSGTELIDAISNAATPIEKRKLELAAKLQSGMELSRPQMVAVGMISILPYLIGAAVKGKKGLALAAPASAIAGTGAIAGFKENFEKGQRADLEEYKDLSKQTDQATKMMLDTTMGERKRTQGMEDYEKKLDMKKARGMGGAPNINVDKRQFQLTSKAATLYDATEQTARIADQIQQFIQANFKDKETGESFAKTLKEAAERKFEGLDPNSPAAELKSMLTELVTVAQASLIKGAATEKDAQRIEEMLYGGAAFSSLGLINKNLSRFKSRAMESYNTSMRRNKDFAEGNFSPLTEDTLRSNQTQAVKRKLIPFKDGSTKALTAEEYEQAKAEGLING